jgi:DNA topoisomerase-3
MERPRPLEDKEEGKLAGLGTPATRAEIIKNLFDRKYIVEDKKYLVPTKKGEWLIKRLKFDVNLAKLTDVEETTSWEKQLQDDPANFENLIINYVKNSVKTGDIGPGFEKEILGTCPLCGGKICEGKKSYFCSSWNNEKKPCKFTIWKTIAGAKVAANDVKLLLSRKKTGLKNCVSKKEGKQFKTQFRLKDNGEIEFVFDQKGRKPPNKASKGR